MRNADNVISMGSADRPIESSSNPPHLGLGDELILGTLNAKAELALRIGLERSAQTLKPILEREVTTPSAYRNYVDGNCPIPSLIVGELDPSRFPLHLTQAKNILAQAFLLEPAFLKLVGAQISAESSNEEIKGQVEKVRADGRYKLIEKFISDVIDFNLAHGSKLVVASKSPLYEDSDSKTIAAAIMISPPSSGSRFGIYREFCQKIYSQACKNAYGENAAKILRERMLRTFIPRPDRVLISTLGVSQDESIANVTQNGGKGIGPTFLVETINEIFRQGYDKVSGWATSVGIDRNSLYKKLGAEIGEVYTYATLPYHDLLWEQNNANKTWRQIMDLHNAKQPLPLSENLGSRLDVNAVLKAGEKVQYDVLKHLTYKKTQLDAVDTSLVIALAKNPDSALIRLQANTIIIQRNSEPHLREHAKSMLHYDQFLSGADRTAIFVGLFGKTPSATDALNNATLFEHITEKLTPDYAHLEYPADLQNSASFALSQAATQFPDQILNSNQFSSSIQLVAAMQLKNYTTIKDILFDKQRSTEARLIMLAKIYEGEKHLWGRNIESLFELMNDLYETAPIRVAAARYILRKFNEENPQGMPTWNSEDSGMVGIKARLNERELEENERYERWVSGYFHEMIRPAPLIILSQYSNPPVILDASIFDSEEHQDLIALQLAAPTKSNQNDNTLLLQAVLDRSLSTTARTIACYILGSSSPSYAGDVGIPATQNLDELKALEEIISNPQEIVPYALRSAVEFTLKRIPEDALQAADISIQDTAAPRWTEHFGHDFPLSLSSKTPRLSAHELIKLCTLEDDAWFLQDCYFALRDSNSPHLLIFCDEILKHTYHNEDETDLKELAASSAKKVP